MYLLEYRINRALLVRNSIDKANFIRLLHNPQPCTEIQSHLRQGSLG